MTHYTSTILFKRLFIIQLILINSIFAISADQLIGNEITDPTISTKCQSKLRSREMKIKYKQKLWALLNRNKNLVKTIPSNRESLKKQLKLNYLALQREYGYTTNRIEVMTKNVVKSGCPGLKL